MVISPMNWWAKPFLSQVTVCKNEASNMPRAGTLWLVSTESISEPFESICELYLALESGLFLQGFHMKHSHLFKIPSFPQWFTTLFLSQIQSCTVSHGLPPCSGLSQAPCSVLSWMLIFFRSGSPPGVYCHLRSPDMSLTAPLGLQ